MKEKKDFKEYFKSLGEDERKSIRDEFLKLTGLKYPSWYGKMSGNAKFSRLELLALGDICGQCFVD